MSSQNNTPDNSSLRQSGGKGAQEAKKQRSEGAAPNPSQASPPQQAAPSASPPAPANPQNVQAQIPQVQNPNPLPSPPVSVNPQNAQSQNPIPPPPPLSQQTRTGRALSSTSNMFGGNFNPAFSGSGSSQVAFVGSGGSGIVSPPVPVPVIPQPVASPIPQVPAAVMPVPDPPAPAAPVAVADPPVQNAPDPDEPSAPGYFSTLLSSLKTGLQWIPGFRPKEPVVPQAEYDRLRHELDEVRNSKEQTNNLLATTTAHRDQLQNSAQSALENLQTVQQQHQQTLQQAADLRTNLADARQRNEQLVAQGQAVTVERNTHAQAAQSYHELADFQKSQRQQLMQQVQQTDPVAVQKQVIDAKTKELTATGRARIAEQRRQDLMNDVDRLTTERDELSQKYRELLERSNTTLLDQTRRAGEDQATRKHKQEELIAARNEVYRKKGQLKAAKKRNTELYEEKYSSDCRVAHVEGQLRWNCKIITDLRSELETCQQNLKRAEGIAKMNADNLRTADDNVLALLGSASASGTVNELAPRIFEQLQSMLNSVAGVKREREEQELEVSARQEERPPQRPRISPEPVRQAVRAAPQPVKQPHILAPAVRRMMFDGAVTTGIRMGLNNVTRSGAGTARNPGVEQKISTIILSFTGPPTSGLPNPVGSQNGNGTQVPENSNDSQVPENGKDSKVPENGKDSKLPESVLKDIKPPSDASTDAQEQPALPDTIPETLNCFDSANKLKMLWPEKPAIAQNWKNFLEIQIDSAPFLVQDNPATGACFFQSVANCLRRYHPKLTHTVLREGVCSYTLDHPKKVEPFLTRAQFPSLADYVKKMALPSTVATEIEIASLKEKFHINIHIYDLAGSHIKQHLCEKPAIADVKIAHCNGAYPLGDRKFYNHYVALIPATHEFATRDLIANPVSKPYRAKSSQDKKRRGSVLALADPKKAKI